MVPYETAGEELWYGSLLQPSNWVFWLAVNMRDFEKLPIREHSVEWNMRIGVIISDEPRINDEIRVSQVRLHRPERRTGGSHRDFRRTEPGKGSEPRSLSEVAAQRETSGCQAHRLRQVQVQREDQGS